MAPHGPNYTGSMADAVGRTRTRMNDPSDLEILKHRCQIQATVLQALSIENGVACARRKLKTFALIEACIAL